MLQSLIVLGNARENLKMTSLEIEPASDMPESTRQSGTIHHNPANRRRDRSRAFYVDIALALLLVSSLVVACVLLSGKKDLWVDEGYSLALVTDPSFVHSMYSLTHAVDGGMPLYYVVVRLWVKLYGASLLSLRLFSCLGISVGLLILWRVLCRFQSNLAAVIAIFSAAGTSVFVLSQIAEARFYGVYFACAAGVLAVHYLLVKRTASKSIVLFAILVHLLLVMSHPLGVLYSGAAILALAISDLLSSSFRLLLYLRLCSAWLVLLIWIRPLSAVADLGRPHNWAPVPSVADVFIFFLPSLSLLFVSIPIIAILSLLKSGTARPAAEEIAHDPFWKPLLLHGFAYLAVPVLVAVISWLGHPLFVYRYFLPSMLGASIVMGYVLHIFLPGKTMSTLQTGAAWVLALGMFAWPAWDSWRSPARHFYQFLDRATPPGIPVIVEDGDTFIPLTYYSHQKNSPYFYAMDWETALHSRSAHATVEHKLLRNAKAVGYYRDRIISTEDALCSFERFIVLDSPGLAWFEERVLPNSSFQVQLIGAMANSDPGPTKVWLVSRLSRPTGCQEPASLQ